MSRAEEIFSRIKEKGMEAINAFIEDRATEELFLDFKLSKVDKKATRLSDIDRGNLAKAISGFGNSEGGVIVWGIDCRNDSDGADVAQYKKPIENPKRYRGWIEGAITALTLPAHNSVEVFDIEESEGFGYVVVLIPKSIFPPHQVVKELKYYMRSGSNFSAVPHGVLAGLFGKRPSPEIKHDSKLNHIEGDGTEVTVKVWLDLWNIGIGLANDLYYNCLVSSTPGPKSVIYLQQANPDFFDTRCEDGESVHCVAKVEKRLAPDSSITPCLIKVILQPPFDEGLGFEISYGCDGAIPTKINLSLTREDVQFVYHSFKNGTEDKVKEQELMNKFFDSAN